MTVMPAIVGIDPDAVKPIAAIRQLRNTPVLLIHGTGDTTVPAADSEALYSAAANPQSQLWLVPGAGHIESHAEAQAEYDRRVLNFLTRQMPAPKSDASSNTSQGMLGKEPNAPM